jgi:hypothetical protein
MFFRLDIRQSQVKAESISGAQGSEVKPENEPVTSESLHKQAGTTLFAYWRPRYSLILAVLLREAPGMQ